MPIDAGIYNLLDTKGLQQGLAGIGEAYAQGVNQKNEQANRLSQLAMQQDEMAMKKQQFAEQQKQHQEAAKQKALQGLASDMHEGLLSGADTNTLGEYAHETATKLGLSDEETNKLLAPLYTYHIENTPEALKKASNSYLSLSNPAESSKVKLEQAYPKHLVGDTPEIVKLQNFAANLPEGKEKAALQARIELLGSRAEAKEQFQEVGAPGKGGDWRIKARVGVDGKPEYFGAPYQIGQGVTAANRIAPATEYEKVIQKAIGKENASIVEAGKNAANIIDNAQMIRDTIQRGAITGTGAGPRLALEKAMATAGLTGEGKAADTQALMSGLSKITLAGIKTSGLGTGQGFTDKDLRFLNEAISGAIDSTPENMLRVADLSEKVARENHTHASKLTTRWQSDPKMKSYAQDIILPPIPESKKPARRASDNTKGGAKFLGFE